MLYYPDTLEWPRGQGHGLRKIYVKVFWHEILEAKPDSGELRCPAPAVIAYVATEEFFRYI